MNVGRTIGIVIALSLSFTSFSPAHAQLLLLPKSSRRSSHRASALKQPKTATKKNAAQPEIVTNTVVVVTNRPVLVRFERKPDPAKVASEKQTVLKNTVEWELSRANNGASWAQYKLGLRYLNGDGVEKDEATARKWLEVAAASGETQARTKLQMLDSKRDGPLTSKNEFNPAPK